MRVWIDFANSPHVALFEPVVDELRREGWDVVLTARDHAQTLELARRRWPQVLAIGGESPPGRARKARVLASRVAELRRFARSTQPNVALSHGSYAQVVAARLAGIPAVTMMDYEHQPANHLSFRLARRVIVPAAFPDDALRRFGVRPARAVRYAGFKEELYLAGFAPDPAVLDELGLSRDAVTAVMRPPPDGALYHRMVNRRFDELLESARRSGDVKVVVLPRSREQTERYKGLAGVLVPSSAVDAPSLLALADVAIGAGGTMNRESALLGTPTYTVFSGRLAAVDRELIRSGRLFDLREPGGEPTFEKKRGVNGGVSELRRMKIVKTIARTLLEVAE